ncbi:hypothetical protein ACJMK2_038041 [Sinanodonta woodiana]|uniref:Uncharacterized protein n=1 Tax=Sinanodonta woodiana TaxID=1069815 RepID=A0ABD3WQT9_SINWO
MDKDAAEVNAVAPPPYQHILGQPQGQWPTGQPEQQGYGQPDQPQVITSQGYAYGQQWQPQTVTSQGSFVPSQPQVYQTYQEPGHPEVITAQMNVPKVVPILTFLLTLTDRQTELFSPGWYVSAAFGQRVYTPSCMHIRLR